LYNYYQNETPTAESRTEKHWHTSLETCLLGYEGAADWMINSAFYPSRFLPGESVVTALTQKRAVFPAYSSREVTSGKMRKIGIHFIIYHNAFRKPDLRTFRLPYHFIVASQWDGNPALTVLAECYIAHAFRAAIKLAQCCYQGCAEGG